MGFLHLARIGCHSAAALHAAENGRGGNNHHALPLRARRVPRALHSQLDLPILLRCAAILGPYRCHRRCRPDRALLRFLLDLLHQVCLPRGYDLGEKHANAQPGSSRARSSTSRCKRFSTAKIILYTIHQTTNTATAVAARRASRSRALRSLFMYDSGPRGRSLRSSWRAQIWPD